MIGFKKKIVTALFLFFLLFFTQNTYSEDQNVFEILEIIQKDLKTLEKAVYSQDVKSEKSISNNQNDVLTKHLLKLNEIEDQFRELSPCARFR